MMTFGAFFGVAIVNKELFSPAAPTLPLIRANSSNNLATLLDVVCAQSPVHSVCSYAACNSITSTGTSHCGFGLFSKRAVSWIFCITNDCWHTIHLVGDGAAQPGHIKLAQHGIAMGKAVNSWHFWHTHPVRNDVWKLFLCSTCKISFRLNISVISTASSPYWLSLCRAAKNCMLPAMQQLFKMLLIVLVACFVFIGFNKLSTWLASPQSDVNKFLCTTLANRL